jgi:long-chain acyl-CoA synthetase
VSQYPWISEYEEGVRSEIDFEGYANVVAAIDGACRKFARRPAATCMGASLNFHEYQESTVKLAAFLQKELKLCKGDRVALILPNTIQFIVSEIAVMRAGGICVNTNPQYSPREMAHQLKDSGAKVVIVLDLFASKLESILGETQVEHIIMTSIADQLPAWRAFPTKLILKLKGQVPTHKLDTWSFTEALRIGAVKKFEEVPILLDDIAILQYTGGTTGVAKGAMLTHRNILANMFQIKEVTKPHLQPGHEVVLTALPLYHVFALSVNFLTFFASGHHLILIPKPTPISVVVEIFKRFPISVMTGVNTLFNSMNHSSEFKKLAPRSLKVAIAGGMALQDHVAKSFQEITGTKVTEGFGLTEASPVTHVNPLKLNTPVGSIGIPLPSTTAKVVNDQGDEVPVGEVGELIISGPQVMKGYWNRQDETDKTLKNGWLWTGDMAKMNQQGYFFIVDRKKDMILVSGFNVYPNEVEEVLSSHPKVLESAVIGIKDENSGEIVKAFVVKKDPSLTLEEIKDHCKANLAGYKVPRRVEFVESLPKSNVGKILRRELKG